MTMPAEETVQLDWRGMKCPQPIINTAKITRELGVRRARLIILADDEAFPLDLKAWVKSAKAELLTIRQLPGEPNTHEAIVIINPQAQLVAAQAIQAPAVARQFIQADTMKPKPSSPEPSPTSQLDCRGMRCPEPIISLAKLAREAGPGQLIEIQADDEAFPLDLKAWAKSAKAEVIELKNEQGLSTPRTPRHKRPQRPQTPCRSASPRLRGCNALRRLGPWA